MGFKRILVFSDNHGDQISVKKLLSEVKYDYVAFAGDWDDDDTRLRNTFNFYVRGNNDFPEMGMEIDKVFEVEGVRFFMTHGHYYGSLFSKVSFQKMLEKAKETKASVVIFGHSHVKKLEEKEGIVFLNPGSLTYPRDSNKGSYATIDVWKGKIINITHHVFNVK